jgi:phosphoribosyl-ATP pyrophosphohydrolase
MSSEDILARLAAVVEERKQSHSDKSYVARLFQKGEDAILKKIGEEATEVVMACKDGKPPQIVGEMADLWFHCLLALNWHGLQPKDVLQELERREGLSGLDEFALRQSQTREAVETPDFKKY